MKPLLLFLLLIITAPLAAQQQRKLDSLKNILAKLPTEGKSFGSDTVRVRVLCEMGLYEADSALSINHILHGKTLASKISWETGEGIALNSEGFFLLREGNHYQGIDKLLLGLQIAEKTKNLDQMGFGYRYLGAGYFLLEDDILAIKYYEQAKEIYGKLKSTSLQNLKNHSVVLSNIGLSLIRIKDFKKAIGYYKSAIEESKILNDSTSKAWMYGNLGIALRENGNLDNALIDFDIAINLFGKGSNDNRGLAYSDKALTLLYQKNEKESLKMALEAKEIAKNAPNFIKQIVYETLFKAYKANGDYYNTIITMDKWYELKNSSEAEMKKKSIEGLASTFENKKNEVEIKYQKQQNKILFIVISLLFCLSSLIFYNFRVVKSKNKKIKEQGDKISEINSELENLNKGLEKKVETRTSELQKAYNEIKDAMVKGQTIERKRVASELHDNLGSMISSIKFQMQAISLESLNDKEKRIYNNVYGLIGDTYNEVRLISHNMLPASLELKGIKGAITELIEEINLADRVKFSLEFDNNINLDKKTEVELYSICLELINNILKHSKAKNADINFIKDKNKIYISISDDGVGMLDHQQSGMGLKNIKTRLNTINGEIEYRTFKNEGTAVILTLNF